MAHSLLRLKESLIDKPHLATPELVSSIFEYLNSRDSITKLESFLTTDTSTRTSYSANNKIGIIDLEGPLSYKPTGFEAYCGGMSYLELQDSVIEMADKGVKNIVMVSDSGGGEAFGMIETGRWLRKYADDNGIRLIAYAEGVCASACYGLSCAAHEFYSMSDSSIGSIGVVVTLRNNSKALEKAGVQHVYLSAGDSKVPYAEDGSYKPEFIADIQESIDILYNEFVEYVAEMRDIPESAVRDTQAKVFTATKAAELGLVDALMSREEFQNYLYDISENKSLRDPSNMKFKFKTQPQEKEMALEEIQATLEAVQAELAVSTEQQATLQATLIAKEAEHASLTASLSDALAELTSLKEAATLLQAKAKEEKLSLRKEQLSSVLDTEKAEATFAVLAEVDDAIFEMAFAGYKAAHEAEANTDAFNEIGSNAQGKADAEKPDAVKAELEKKFKKQ